MCIQQPAGVDQISHPHNLRNYSTDLHKFSGFVDVLECFIKQSLAICHPSGCTVASGVVVVVVVGGGGGVCNRSQMRTSKYTCLICASIGLDPG